MTKKTLTQRLEKVKHHGEKAFVPYIMAGDGGLETIQAKYTISTRSRCDCN